MAKKKETAKAKQPKKETAEANDKRATAKPSSKTMKIRITAPVAWMGFSYDPGAEVTMQLNQAQELIDNGCAEKL